MSKALSLQAKLPRRRRIPYKEGKWHPIITKMNRGKERIPYDVKFIYNFSEDRDYGIPYKRRK